MGIHSFPVISVPTFVRINFGGILSRYPAVRLLYSTFQADKIVNISLNNNFDNPMEKPS